MLQFPGNSFPFNDDDAEDGTEYRGYGRSIRGIRYVLGYLLLPLSSLPEFSI